MIPILILAAGRSSRMRGRDKLLEEIDDEPLLSRLTRFAIATGEPVFVALPSMDHPRSTIVRSLGATPLVTQHSSEGLGGTMRGAVKLLPSADAFMILLGDLPEIETSDISAVLNSRAANPAALIWRGATEDGAPGHPIIFDASLRKEFERLGGDNGGGLMVRSMQDKTQLVPLKGSRALLDLDTPEDWADWRAQRQRP